MPNKPNARKSLRQNIKRAALNRMRTNNFKNAIKKTLKATTAEEAKNLIKIAQKALDKAAKEGTIKKNTASRKLARLAKKINKIVKK